MTFNEEKGDMWFVWEKTTIGMGVRYKAARYRELPKTGMGVDADNERFKFKIKLEGKEADPKLPLITLINKYACPVDQDPLPEPLIPRV